MSNKTKANLETASNPQYAFPKLKVNVPPSVNADISGHYMALLKRLQAADGYKSLEHLLNDMIQVWAKHIHPDWELTWEQATPAPPAKDDTAR